MLTRFIDFLFYNDLAEIAIAAYLCAIVSVVAFLLNAFLKWLCGVLPV